MSYAICVFYAYAIQYLVLGSRIIPLGKLSIPVSINFLLCPVVISNTSISEPLGSVQYSLLFIQSHAKPSVRGGGWEDRVCGFDDIGVGKSPPSHFFGQTVIKILCGTLALFSSSPPPLPQLPCVRHGGGWH